MEIKELTSAIHSHIRIHAPDCDPVTQSLMAASLAEFCQMATSKFNAGQREHGGRIVDRDLDKELMQETVDSFWYSSAKKWPAYMIPFPPTKTKTPKQ